MQLVETVANEEVASDYLKQHHDVIGLIIDTGLCEGQAENWLIRLRTQLAWAGLPALFVAQPEDIELKALLAKFDAPCIEQNEQQPQAILEALTLLLQGKR